MATSVIDGDVQVRGTLTPKGFSCPAGAIGSANFSGSDPLESAKQKHRHVGRLNQVHGSAAAAERRACHVARSAGSVLTVQAGVVVACVGDSTITVDVRKNGASILTGTITINNTHAAYAKVSGVVNTAAYVAGDVFEVVVTVSAGTGALGQGLFVDVVFDEAA